MLESGIHFQISVFFFSDKNSSQDSVRQKFHTSTKLVTNLAYQQNKSGYIDAPVPALGILTFTPTVTLPCKLQSRHFCEPSGVSQPCCVIVSVHMSIAPILVNLLSQAFTSSYGGDENFYIKIRRILYQESVGSETFVWHCL